MRPLAVVLYSIIVCASLSAFAACHSAPVPPSCPPGHTRLGDVPPDGAEVWCQTTIDGKSVKDGIFIAYNPDGSKMLEGTYHNGEQEGEWTIWYENGQRASIDHYTNGTQNGLHTSWYANGTMALTGVYRDGKREGVWTSWDPSGLKRHNQVYDQGKAAP
jgi:hypothetical protein